MYKPRTPARRAGEQAGRQDVRMEKAQGSDGERAVEKRP